MYSYNSYHKILTGLLVVAWAIFHFSSRSNDHLKYENGQEKRIGTQKNNLNHGTWTWFHENGQTQLTGKFDAGNRVGVWKSYDTEGNLLIESTYANNRLNGLFTKYTPEGEIVNQYIYRADTIQKRLVE